jgi:hypothetical protein
VPYSFLFATILPRQASNNHTNSREETRESRNTVSLKAIIVVVWACLIAGAAIASENHRLCVEHHQTELIRLHQDLQLNEEEFEVLIVARVDVTN